MGLKQKVQKQKDSTPVTPVQSSNSNPLGKELSSYIQAYLAWLKLQNPRFNETLTTEELANYFFGGLNLPDDIVRYMEDNPLQILSKLYEYIDRYKDKTEMFTINREILPKLKGNYKEVSHV